MSSSSEGYILNAIQTTGGLYPVYRSIANGSETKAAIKEETNIDAGLSAALDGLLLLRMIGKEDGEYYARDYEWDQGPDRLNFRLSALHHLAAECRDGDWGKQAVVLLNYAYLLENDIQFFKNNDEALYTNIDQWSIDLDYRPQSQQGRIEHNDPKFGNWTRLVHFLGLVHKVEGREHTVYPDPELVRASLRLALNDKGMDVDGSPGIEIDDYLGWLRENLLYVNATSEGDVPEPLARVLFEFVRDDAIQIVEYGDAGAVGLEGVPPYKGIDSEANTIVMIQDEQ